MIRRAPTGLGSEVFNNGLASMRISFAVGLMMLVGKSTAYYTINTPAAICRFLHEYQDGGDEYHRPLESAEKNEIRSYP